MSEITDEMLRRFAEAGGWKYEERTVRLMAYGQDNVPTPEQVGPCWWSPADVICSPPNYRHNIAACLEVLERACVRHLLLWQVGSTMYPEESKRFFCQTERQIDPSEMSSERVSYGPTKQDAVILAVLATGARSE